MASWTPQKNNFFRFLLFGNWGTSYILHQEVDEPGYNGIDGEPVDGSRDMTLSSLREGIGDCLECGWKLSRVIPSTFVSSTIQKYMPEVMAASCIKCHREFLIQRVDPHGVRGTIMNRKSGKGWHQSIFFADGGELVVGQEEEICH